MVELNSYGEPPPHIEADNSGKLRVFLKSVWTDTAEVTSQINHWVKTTDGPLVAFPSLYDGVLGA